MNDSEEHITRPALRASDAERDQVEAQLQHHYAVGRPTLPELEERVAAAYEARTREQLRALLRDLPGEVEVPASPISCDRLPPADRPAVRLASRGDHWVVTGWCPAGWYKP
ncbi:DUF1707 SHOCT-like domain-containing protein [Streptomyces mirabilis]|uniref:DUF1707 SHOCT-like domain-containing protein n=1 Tax=Streptomyces mirabilis TaxID=68239 RepID=UPI0036DE75D5